MKKILYLFIFFNFLCFSNLFAEEEYFSAKIISLISENEITTEESIEKILKFQVEILEGEKRGENIEIELPVYKEKQYNILAKVGDKVVLYRSYDENYDMDETLEEMKENYQKEKYRIERIDISDVDKRKSYYTLIGIFCILTFIIARKNGLKALISLLMTLTFIVKIFIPMISKGNSPIFWAVITCIFSTFITTLFITGFSKKTFIVILGTTSGVLISGFLSYYFTDVMRLTGYSDAETLSYAHIIMNINLKELISAGVIIGSLGAVMDVAVSIASSINEIYENNSKIEFRNLFIAAMNIGNDIIGTMINTLVLAYIGSSILTLLLVYLQSSDYPLIRILNYENIVIEILRAICGSIGILIVIPFTAYIGARIYKRNK